MSWAVRFRDELNGLSSWITEELDGLIAQISSTFEVEHDVTGHHTDITGISINLTGAAIFGGSVTSGGAGRFGGDVTANYARLLTAANLAGPWESKLSGTEGNASVLGPSLNLGRKTDNFAWQIIANTVNDVSRGQSTLEFIAAKNSATSRRAMQLTQADTAVNGEYYLTGPVVAVGKLFLGALTTTIAGGARIVKIWTTDIDSTNGYFERGRVVAAGEWNTYTPTWTSGGVAVTVGNGQILGYYAEVGKTVYFRIFMQVGGTTVFNAAGNQIFGLPNAAVVGGIQLVIGHAVSQDVGVANYFAQQVILNSANDMAIFDAAGNIVSTAFPFAWGATDQMYIQGFYEKA